MYHKLFSLSLGLFAGFEKKVLICTLFYKVIKNGQYNMFVFGCLLAPSYKSLVLSAYELVERKAWLSSRSNIWHGSKPLKNGNVCEL